MTIVHAKGIFIINTSLGHLGRQCLTNHFRLHLLSLVTWRERLKTRLQCYCDNSSLTMSECDDGEWVKSIQTMFENEFRSSSPNQRRTLGGTTVFSSNTHGDSAYFGKLDSNPFDDEQSWGRWISSSFATTTLPSMRTLPLPKLGLKPSWFRAGKDEEIPL